ncbi:MAG: hypothetical protein LBG87_09355, partial [Spirochaetaceae bacterium]|nr:hypothetical protein [Spirochaetaceae bacterium]
MRKLMLILIAFIAAVTFIRAFENIKPATPAAPGFSEKNGEALTQPQAADGEEIPLNMIETFAWDTYTVRRGDNI